jgi:hypothetical protein
VIASPAISSSIKAAAHWAGVAPAALAVASRKILCRGAISEWTFRHDEPLRRDFSIEPVMLGRVDRVHCTAKHSNGASGQAGGMRLAVNTQGEAGNRSIPGAAKRGGYIAGELSSGGGRLPRADYGQAGFGG